MSLGILDLGSQYALDLSLLMLHAEAKDAGIESNALIPWQNSVLLLFLCTFRFLEEERDIQESAIQVIQRVGIIQS